LNQLQQPTMPTCTLPFEILFEFTNDTLEAATLQLMRGGDDPFSGGGGAMVLLHGRGDSVSLVLNAGSTYSYRLKQGRKVSKILVRTWQDVKCTATSVFSRTEPSFVADTSWARPLNAVAPLNGLAVTHFSCEP